MKTKVKLNVGERLTAMQLLPQEGNFLTLKLTKDVIDILGINEKDFKEFEIKAEVVDDKTMTTWNKKGTEEVEFELGPKTISLISDSLVKLDKDGKLTNQHFSLYEKFCKTEE